MLYEKFSKRRGTKAETNLKYQSASYPEYIVYAHLVLQTTCSFQSLENVPKFPHADIWVHESDHRNLSPNACKMP